MAGSIDPVERLMRQKGTFRAKKAALVHTGLALPLSVLARRFDVDGLTAPLVVVECQVHLALLQPGISAATTLSPLRPNCDQTWPPLRHTHTAH